MRKKLAALVVAAFAVAVLGAPTGMVAAPGTTTRVSVGSDGTQDSGGGGAPAISADGRFAAFESRAVDLVAGDTNNTSDIFVRDLQAGITVRVSVSSSGTQTLCGPPNFFCSTGADIDASGRFVVFTSTASDLVPADTTLADVFVHDRDADEDGVFDETGAITTQKVSASITGGTATGESSHAAISADGRFVAFSSSSPDLVAGDSNMKRDIFVHDRQTGLTGRASVDSLGAEGNGDSGHWERGELSMSGDGRYVAFRSDATNLVAGDTNAFTDVFIHDREAGLTERVSVASSGLEGNSPSGVLGLSVSDDGRTVAFHSAASNLIAGDTNGSADVFVHDRHTGSTSRVSIGNSQAQADFESLSPSINSDGRFVAFTSGV